MLSELKRKILFPGSLYNFKKSEFHCSEGATLIPLPTNNLKEVTVLFGDSLSKESSLNEKHLIFFYGNGGSISMMTSEFEFFRNIGINVWIPDYMGYGFSSGTPSEKGCQETAKYLLDYLIYDKEINLNQIFVCGHSLGAAIALDLVYKTNNLGGLILISPFTSIIGMINRIPITKFIPLNLLVQQRFDNFKKIQKVTIPTIIAHGKHDRIIPHQMGEVLFNNLKLPEKKCKFFSVENANHNSILEFGDPKLVNGIIDFLNNL